MCVYVNSYINEVASSIGEEMKYSLNHIGTTDLLFGKNYIQTLYLTHHSQKLIPDGLKLNYITKTLTKMRICL